MTRYICYCEKLALPREKYCESCDQYKKMEAERDCLLFELELTAAHEREACAKICEETTASWSQHDYNSGCIDCAKAIRARGEK